MVGHRCATCGRLIRSDGNPAPGPGRCLCGTVIPSQPPDIGDADDLKVAPAEPPANSLLGSVSLSDLVPPESPSISTTSALAAQTTHRDSAVDEVVLDHWSRGEKLLLWGGLGVAVVAAAGFLLWFLVIHDARDADRLAGLGRRADTTLSLARDATAQGALDKHEAVPRVEGRQLSGSDVRGAVANIPLATRPTGQQEEAARQQAERQRQQAEAVASIADLESQAKALVDGGEFEQGVEKYQQALDLSKHVASPSAELATVIVRITQAKESASMKLDEQRRMEDASRKRAEEEKRLASIRASIKGTAWLTTKAGDRDPLRGLQILVLRDIGTRAQLLAMARVRAEGEKDRLARAKLKLAAAERQLEQAPQSKLAKEKYSNIKEEVELHQVALKFFQEQLEISGAAGDLPVDFRCAFMGRAAFESQNEAAVWETVCSQQLVGTARTDVDGKYSIRVPPGRYYLYAVFESSKGRATWFVPAVVLNAKDVGVDLQNDNASSIIPRELLLFAEESK